MILYTHCFFLTNIVFLGLHLTKLLLCLVQRSHSGLSKTCLKTFGGAKLREIQFDEFSIYFDRKRPETPKDG